MSQGIMKYQQKELQAEREKNKVLCDRIAALETSLRNVIQPIKPRLHGHGHGLISTCQFCSGFARGTVGHSDIDHDWNCPRQTALELLGGAE